MLTALCTDGQEMGVVLTVLTDYRRVGCWQLCVLMIRKWVWCWQFWLCIDRWGVDSFVYRQEVGGVLTALCTDGWEMGGVLTAMTVYRQVGCWQLCVPMVGKWVGCWWLWLCTDRWGVDSFVYRQVGCWQLCVLMVGKWVGSWQLWLCIDRWGVDSFVYWWLGSGCGVDLCVLMGGVLTALTVYRQVMCWQLCVLTVGK